LLGKALCNLVQEHEQFRGTYCLHIYVLFTVVSVRIFSLLDSKSSQFAIGHRINVSAIYKIKYFI